MGVDHGRLDVGVTHPRLRGAQRHTDRGATAPKRVPEVMEATSRTPARFQSPFEALADLAAIKRVARVRMAEHRPDDAELLRGPVDVSPSSGRRCALAQRPCRGDLDMDECAKHAQSARARLPVLLTVLVLLASMQLLPVLTTPELLAAP